MIHTSIRATLIVAFTLWATSIAFAQPPDDAVLRPAEPDFALISLPTSLRPPQGKIAARFTHRFGLRFNNGEPFSDFAGQLFGLDSGATVGLEVRVGLAPGLQAGLHHSSDNRTWDFFGQYGVIRQTSESPIDVSIVASLDLIREPIALTADFERKAAPSVGAIVSHAFGEHGAVYAEPIFVSNIFNEFATPDSDDKALVLGLGARARVRPTLYLVAEFAPRVGGFSANTNHAGFAIEKRVGGHVFQLNATNSFATTFSQLAMGGEPGNDWHLGFNISRKFF